MRSSRPQDNRSPTVSLAACETLDRKAVEQAVLAALAPLGGMRRFVSPGAQVLLKPNMLGAFPPSTGVTTHPEFVAAAGRIFKEEGARVAVGDSPNGVHMPERVWEASGIHNACER